LIAPNPSEGATPTLISCDAETPLHVTSTLDSTPVNEAVTVLNATVAY
jgi:hypothetical protein